MPGGQPRPAIGVGVHPGVGVPLYDVKALLGHVDYATTQRYAHLAPDAHDKVIESWTRRADGSGRR